MIEDRILHHVVNNRENFTVVFADENLIKKGKQYFRDFLKIEDFILMPFERIIPSLIHKRNIIDWANFDDVEYEKLIDTIGVMKTENGSGDIKFYDSDRDVIVEFDVKINDLGVVLLSNKIK